MIYCTNKTFIRIFKFFDIKKVFNYRINSNQYFLGKIFSYFLVK